MPTFVYDDYYGDERSGSSTSVPTYLPAVNQWDPIGGTCPSCTLSSNLPITIDASKVQNGTWHSTTVSPDEPETTISITFNGTAVSAFCLLPPNFGTDITSYMNVTFSLDGQMVGKFERIADTTDWTYNASVFSTSGLENKEHTFVVQPRGDVNTSYIVFDYFTYNWEEPPPTSSSSAVPSTSSTPASSGSAAAPTGTSSSTPAVAGAGSSRSSAGPIAGGVVAGLAALALAGLAFWLLARRRALRKGDKIYSGGRGFSLDLEERSAPPPPMPFMAGMAEVGYSSVPSSADALIARPAAPAASTSAGPSVYSDSAPSAASTMPSSADEKRALQEASLQRMREMEQRIAGGGVVDAEESLKMRREIDNLRSQVEELTAALRMQLRDETAYDEPPPSYEAGTRTT